MLDLLIVDTLGELVMLAAGLTIGALRPWRLLWTDPVL